MAKSAQQEDAPEMTPQVLHLRDLLKWVRMGRVRVPNFQRDFTWDRPRMLSLFDSIRRQYPIGTLLFWESSTPRPMLPHLGPLRIPDFHGTTSMVLDGQQRLTTLAGVLLLDELPRNTAEDRDPQRWLMFYDAASDAFAYFSETPPPSAVRLVDLVVSKGLYRATNRMLSDSPVEGPLWVERLEAVSAALASYRIPLVTFATDSLRLVVESFTRLNRSGQRVGPDEMLSALTYSHEAGRETFRLATHIDSILAERRSEGFGEVDRVAVLRSILLAAGLDPYRTDWDALAASSIDRSRDVLPDAITEARRGLASAVVFLRSEGIFNSRLLPYSVHLIGIAAFFGALKGPATPEQERLLRRWLWVSAFTEAFGGFNSSRILPQLKDLREVVARNQQPIGVRGIDLNAAAHLFPERLDQRSARARALLCVMLKDPVCRPDGSQVMPTEVARDVLERGPNALARICAQVPGTGGSLLAASPANRLFAVEQRGRGQAKNWLLTLPSTCRDQVLQSHHISADAYWALENGDHRLFIKERTETLMSLERVFLVAKGVRPPERDFSAPSAMDVEDEVPLSEYDLGDEVV